MHSISFWESNTQTENSKSQLMQKDRSRAKMWTLQTRGFLIKVIYSEEFTFDRSKWWSLNILCVISSLFDFVFPGWCFKSMSLLSVSWTAFTIVSFLWLLLCISWTAFTISVHPFCVCVHVSRFIFKTSYILYRELVILLQGLVSLCLYVHLRRCVFHGLFSQFHSHLNGVSSISVKK